MLTPQLRKFTTLYDKYGLGAVRNIHLLVQLLLVGRTASLWKLKDYLDLILGNVEVQAHNHYRRLTRFFDDWQDDAELQVDVQRQVFRTLRRLRFAHLLLDGTSWKLGDQKYHYNGTQCLGRFNCHPHILEATQQDRIIEPGGAGSAFYGGAQTL
jgi:hypothetical protein